MPKKVRTELSGRKVGKLTVLSYAYSQKGKHGTQAFWTCLCECGKTKNFTAKHLIKEMVKSCGCGQGFFTHGRWGKTEYAIWNNMIARCHYPSATHYSYYGGRGIKVCNAWRQFSNFYADMGLRPSLDHSIDRIDANGDYCLENCRWATKHEQAQNMKGVVLNPSIVKEIRTLGKKISIGEMTALFKVSKSTIYEVLARRSWPNV